MITIQVALAIVCGNFLLLKPSTIYLKCTRAIISQQSALRHYSLEKRCSSNHKADY